MKIAAHIARILLGLMFTMSGLTVFVALVFPFNMPEAPPGLASDFTHVFFTSHWVYFVDAVQALSGILLLVNRYVPLALTILAGIIYNILAFHITIEPNGLPVAIVTAVLWFLAYSQYRESFAPLLAAKPATTPTAPAEAHVN
ncbi:MAG TPA: hypothetical protein VGK19_13470 [Capsulimonadaceae bacterium]|jgi:Zn-dependent protease with chaperone function